MDTVGIGMSAVGVCLTIWAIWYARKQGERVRSIKRSEMIALWALLDRIRTIILQMERDGVKSTGINEENIQRITMTVLPQVFKGICDHYVNIVELIVEKTPGLTLEGVVRWRREGRLKTEWQEAQFKNLVEAAMSVE